MRDQLSKRTERALLKLILRLRAWRSNSDVANTLHPSTHTFDPNDFGIAITTFEPRFFSFALPLISNIREVSDVPIFLAINSNMNGPAKTSNFMKLLAGISKYENVYPISFGSMAGCSNLWNKSIQLASKRALLIVNDDISINPSSLKRDLDEIWQESEKRKLFTINGSWSHFCITGDCIKSVGYFDEHFLGFGAEDSDYHRRYMAVLGSEPFDLRIDGFVNLNSEIRDESIKTDGKKYTSFNYLYYDIKLQIEHFKSLNPINNRTENPNLEKFRQRYFPLLQSSDSEKTTQELLKYWMDSDFDSN